MSSPSCASLVGDSAAVRALRASAEAAALRDCPVLLEGERGSGREHLARWLHAHSRRKSGAFIRIDAEFAGSERAADKLRRAHGGTALIKDLPFAPARLRHLLVQHLPDADGESEIQQAETVRLIATSDVPVEHTTRDDEPLLDPRLVQALAARRLVVPPLRQRLGDVPALAVFFLRATSAQAGGPARSLTPRALDGLLRYSWPGNLAELRDVLRRAAMRTRDARIDLGDIESVLPPLHERVPMEELSLEDVVRVKLRVLLQRLEGHAITDLYEQVLGHLERPLLDEVLRRTGGNQIQAAKMLGINRNTLRKKLTERGVGAIASASVAEKAARSD